MNDQRKPEQIRVLKEREFSPHHILIGAAHVALEDAEKKIPGWVHFELVAITFSALALEAVANSFGEKFIIRWKDFESSSPIAKLRLVCSRLNIAPDFEQEPWSAALWLVAFRNKVAHAKPEMIKTDEIFAADEYAKSFHEYPPSRIEEMVSLENAKRSVKAIEKILELFLSKLTLEEMGGLFSDSFSAHTLHVNDQ